MDDLDKLENRLKKIVENNEKKDKAISGLIMENDIMAKRYSYMLNKLREASVIYGEAGKKILDFVEKETNEIIAKMGEMDKKLNSCISLSENTAADLRSIRSEFAKLSADVAKKEENKFLDIDRNFTRINEKMSELMLLEEHMQVAENKNAVLEEKLKELTKDLEVWQTKFFQLSTRLKSDIEKEKEVMKKERAKTKEDFTKLSKEFSMIVNDSRQKVKLLSNQLMKFEDAKVKLKDDIRADYTASMEKLEERIKTIELKLARLDKMLDIDVGKLVREVEK